MIVLSAEPETVSTHSTLLHCYQAFVAVAVLHCPFTYADLTVVSNFRVHA